MVRSDDGQEIITMPSPRLLTRLGIWLVVVIVVFWQTSGSWAEGVERAAVMTAGGVGLALIWTDLRRRGTDA